MFLSRHGLQLAAFTFTCIVLICPARAQRPDRETIRRELLEAVIAHSRARRYELALSAAKAALDIRRDRETLCNAGLIASRINRFLETAEFLSDCIRLTTEPTDDPEEIQTRLTHASSLAMALTQVGILRILAPALARITVDHRDLGLAPIDHDVFVTPSQAIEIHADNFNGEGHERVTIAPGQSKTVLLHIAPRTPKTLVSKPMVAPAPPPAPPSTFGFSPRTAFKISLFSTIATAGATATFAMASEITSADYSERLDALRHRYNCGCECDFQPDCSTLEDLRDRKYDLRNIAITSGITTGIGLAVTIALGKYMPVTTTAKGLSLSF